jgi:hypothetical protein
MEDYTFLKEMEEGVAKVGPESRLAAVFFSFSTRKPYLVVMSIEENCSPSDWTPVVLIMFFFASLFFRRNNRRSFHCF